MNTSRAYAALMAVLLLHGCGGGGSSADLVAAGSAAGAAGAPPTSDVSVDRSGVAIGTITGFGSIIVNGVRYDTDSATILDDDDAIDLGALAVGDYVVIDGRIDADGTSGVADRVRYDAGVEGPVSSIDAAAGSFVVLGRTVRVDRATVFDADISSRSIAGLSIGARVEVSGLPSAEGGILATRVEPSDDNDFEVKGFVADLDDGAATFRVGTQAVSFAAASFEDFAGAALAEGQFVEVRADGLEGDTLQATVVQLEDNLLFSGADDDGVDERNFDIEGVITAVDGDLVTVGSVIVRIATDADFDVGGPTDLVIGARVELEGQIGASGELIADEVEVESAVDSEFEGLVQAIDLDAGTFELLGITVLVTTSTQFEDDSELRVRTFSLRDLVVGNLVEVRGVLADGTLNAARVERGDNDDGAGGGAGEDSGDDSGDDVSDGSKVEIEGPLQALSGTSMTVNGVTFALNADTRFELNDARVTFAAFEAGVEIGAEVEVDGIVLEDGSFLAADVEVDRES